MFLFQVASCSFQDSEGVTCHLDFLSSSHLYLEAFSGSHKPFFPPCDTFYSVICTVALRSYVYTLFCLWPCAGSYHFPIYSVGFGAKFDQIEIHKGLWGKKPTKQTPAIIALGRPLSPAWKPAILVYFSLAPAIVRFLIFGFVSGWKLISQNPWQSKRLCVYACVCVRRGNGRRFCLSSSPFPDGAQQKESTSWHALFLSLIIGRLWALVENRASFRGQTPTPRGVEGASRQEEWKHRMFGFKCVYKHSTSLFSIEWLAVHY